LTKFLIENISLPQEVEAILDKRTQMGLVGSMGAYTQFQTANAIEEMAKTQGSGGNMMGVLAGVGMGNVVGGAVQGATQQSQALAGPPPLPQVHWYAGIDGKRVGPMTVASLQQWIQEGRITPETLLWKQDLEGWTPAKDIPEVADFFGAVPPPLPT